jgi:hypothetical protein
MPSASTWWNTTTSAPRCPFKPLTMTAAQGGRFNGRRVPTASTATACSAASSGIRARHLAHVPHHGEIGIVDPYRPPA